MIKRGNKINTLLKIMLKCSLLNKIDYLSIASAYCTLSELSMCLMLHFLLKFNYFLTPQKALVCTIPNTNKFYFNNMLPDVSSPFTCLNFPPDDFISCCLILVPQETVRSSSPTQLLPSALSIDCQFILPQLSLLGLRDLGLFKYSSQESYSISSVIVVDLLYTLYNVTVPFLRTAHSIQSRGISWIQTVGQFYCYEQFSIFSC